MLNNSPAGEQEPVNEKPDNDSPSLLCEITVIGYLPLVSFIGVSPKFVLPENTSISLESELKSFIF